MLPDGMRYASITNARTARKIASRAMRDLKDSQLRPDEGAFPARACATVLLGLVDEEERLRWATRRRRGTREDARCTRQRETGWRNRCYTKQREAAWRNRCYTKQRKAAWRNRCYTKHREAAWRKIGCTVLETDHPSGPTNSGAGCRVAGRFRGAEISPPAFRCFAKLRFRRPPLAASWSIDFEPPPLASSWSVDFETPPLASSCSAVHKEKGCARYGRTPLVTARPKASPLFLKAYDRCLLTSFVMSNIDT